MSYVENSVSTRSSFTESRQVHHIVSQVSGAANSVDYCARCTQFIYPLELMGQIMGLRYHKQCFKCSVCDSNLDFKTYKTNLIDLNDKQIYCSSHAPKNGKGTLSYHAAECVIKTIQNESSNGSVASSQTQSIKSLNEVTSVNDVVSFNDITLKIVEPNEEVTPSPSVVIPIVQTVTTTQPPAPATLKFNSQLSNDSVFKKSIDTMHKSELKWDYVDQKESRINRVLKGSVGTTRKQYGPFDSAYKTTNLMDFDRSRVSWKEMFENTEAGKARKTKKSSLDLLDRDEISWREIYENDYKSFRKTSVDNLDTCQQTKYTPNKVAEVTETVTINPVIETVIDSISMDSSLVNKIPSKEKINSSTLDITDRLKSESMASHKEKSTYHHQFSGETKHVSVLVPALITNRDSANDQEHENQMSRPSSPKPVEHKVLEGLVPTLAATPKTPSIVHKKLDSVGQVSKPGYEQQPSLIVIKHTETKIIGDNKSLGVLKLTVHYDELRSRLSITCHQAQ